jgi:hypothetical protein
MNTAYVINSNVTINALLPHRSNVSTMINSPTFWGATLHFHDLARLAAGLKSGGVKSIFLHYVSFQPARL